MENIFIRHITMMNIPTEPLLFDLHYGGKSAVEAAEDEVACIYDIAPMPADETTPEFRNIHISDIICSGAARAMYFNGIPEKNISGIEIRNSTIISDKGADIRYSDGVIMENVEIRQSEGTGVSIANCRNVEISGCSDAGGKIGEDGIFVYKSENIKID